MPIRTLAVLAALLAGCGARQVATLPTDPGVTFAAHRTGDRLVVDRTRSGESGRLDAPGRLREASAPDLVLRVGDETRAALWIVGRSRVLVRDDPSTIAPRAGEVLSSWDGGALRLTLYPRTGAPLTTDPFAREGLHGGERLVHTAPRPAGAYRAPLRDGAGTEVGWLRVELGRSDGVPRVYDGVLPRAVDDGLAAAAAVALDGEIGWIVEHADAR
jgi:hypothetical protein